MRKFIFAALVALTSVFAHAEVFSDVWYWDSLTEVKKKFPNATYIDHAPAWLKPGQRFIEIKGSGLSHTLLIHFEDAGPEAKKLLLERASSADLKTAAEADWITAEIVRLKDHPNDFIRVERVRIVYRDEVPISRFKTRYGEPTSCKFNESFDQVCEWEKRSMSAKLSNDGKFVYQADTYFTLAEQVESFRRRGTEAPAGALE